MKQKFKIFILSLFMSMSLMTINAEAAARISIEAPSSAKVGDTVNIVFKNIDDDYVATGTLSVSGGASGSLAIAISGTGSQSLSVKVSSNKNISISFSGIYDQIGGDFADGKLTASKSISVSAASGGSNTGGSSNSGGSSSGGSNSGGSSSGGSNSSGSDTGSNSGSYNPDLPKGESEAEKKAREEREAAAKLAERKRHPLIKDIVIVSESDRLKGKEVVKLGTEVETFKYSATLPRSIDAFKLDLKAVKDDVKLTYDKMYKLDEGHDKVEVVVKAVQDEVEQTFNITVHRHKESEVSFEDTESNYHLLVDKLIDNELKEFGIERKLFNEKKDDTFYYYEYDDVKFALTYDKDNLARWVLLDDKGELDQEFILLIDAQKKPRFIVDVPLEEDVPTLKGNKYEIVDLELSDDILKLDESMTFNTSVSAWVFDEDGVITHEYVKAPSKDTASTEATVDTSDDKHYKLVYVGKDSVVESAFVSFDNVNKNMEYFAYSMLALLVLMIIIFIVYWRSNSKKINNLLNRR